MSMYEPLGEVYGYRVAILTPYQGGKTVPAAARIRIVSPLTHSEGDDLPVALEPRHARALAALLVSAAESIERAGR